MKIRRILPGDEPEWLRLRVALWPDCPLEQHRLEMAEMTLSAAGQGPEGAGGPLPTAVFVAQRPAGGLGGFLEASLRPYADGCDTRPVGYLEGWYVDPDLRRQGVGAALVRAAEEWARAQGCQEMASDCLLGNELGWRAHLALGYAEVERAIRFSKRLQR